MFWGCNKLNKFLEIVCIYLCCKKKYFLTLLKDIVNYMFGSRLGFDIKNWV